MRLSLEDGAPGRVGSTAGREGSFTIADLQRRGGSAAWAPSAERAQGSSAEPGLDNPEVYLEGEYQRLLGRSVDGEGLATFSQKMKDMSAQGASWEDIQQAIETDIKSSAEYAALQPSSTSTSSGTTPSTSATTIPGAEKAIAYAENPGINPNTGTNDWAYWCLALVNQAYGGGTDGMLRAETATGAFNNYQNAGRIQTEGDPPRGALVFFDYQGKDGVDYGHVGISLGDGTYIGTTTDGTNTGVRSINGSLPYKGWAIP
jgi:CHAP domain